MVATQTIDAYNADIQLLSERELVYDGMTINCYGDNTSFIGYLYTRSIMVQGATHFIVPASSSATANIGLVVQRGYPAYGPTFAVWSFTAEGPVVGVRDPSLTGEAYILIQPIE